MVVFILGIVLKFNLIIFCNDEGIYYIVGKVRGCKKSLDKMVVYVKEKIGNVKVFNLVVVYGDVKEEVIEMEVRFKREFL